MPVEARFCPSCGEGVSAPSVPAGQERRLVTVLFADVTGSTALGEQLDPERLRDVMDTYFGAMREEIEAEGGTVEKFIGDAVMAAFGVPVAHEDDPARALRAALRMRTRLEDVNADLEARFGVTLQVRTGVNTGEVLATIDPKPGEAMVTGDAVNAAARLEQAAEPGQIVASERTVRAARSFRSTPLGEIELKGKADRVSASLIVGEDAGVERGIPGLHAPMVGRERELTLLRSVYERVAAERRPNLVTVYGEAGVGKSRLTHEFLDWVAQRVQAPTIVRGRCLPYGDGVTYWPLAEILKGHANVLDTDPPALVLDKVRTVGRTLLTTDVTSDPDRAAAALAFTVGVEDRVLVHGPGASRGTCGEPRSLALVLLGARPRAAGRRRDRGHPLGGPRLARPLGGARRSDPRRCHVPVPLPARPHRATTGMGRRSPERLERGARAAQRG